MRDHVIRNIIVSLTEYLIIMNISMKYFKLVEHSMLCCKYFKTTRNIMYYVLCDCICAKYKCCNGKFVLFQLLLYSNMDQGLWLLYCTGFW